jgi:hypothetical protein
VNGVRFEQENEFYMQKRVEFLKLGWEKAAKVAKHHVYSRLNALTVLPKAISTKNGNFKKVIAHVLDL